MNDGSIIEALRRLGRVGAPAAATARSTVPWWTLARDRADPPLLGKIQALDLGTGLLVDRHLTPFARRPG